MCVAVALQCLFLICSHTIEQHTSFLFLSRRVYLCFILRIPLLCMRHFRLFHLYICNDLHSLYRCTGLFRRFFVCCRGQASPVFADSIVDAFLIQFHGTPRYGYNWEQGDGL